MSGKTMVYPGDVNASEFLLSYEWRTVRMKVLKRDGVKCACCGASPQTGAVMNVDHIKPRRSHPHLALSLNNLQVLCADCNHGKGNWDDTDWRKKSNNAITPKKKKPKKKKSRWKKKVQEKKPDNVIILRKKRLVGAVYERH